MLKRIVMALALISLFGISTFAQEKPETEMKERKECTKDSKSCCGASEISGMQMKASKETTEVRIWNKVCPIKGESVDTEVPTFEYNGKIIGFCCPGCDSKFHKDPEKYMKNLNEDGTKFIGG